jgi:hypothetical protein
MDAGLRLLYRRGISEWIGDLGLALTVLGIEGQNLTTTTRSTRLDLGAHFGFAVRFWVHRWLAISLSPQVNVSFQPYELVVAPDGIVGTTPRVWIGMSLGLTTGFGVRN